MPPAALRAMGAELPWWEGGSPCPRVKTLNVRPSSAREETPNCSANHLPAAPDRRLQRSPAGGPHPGSLQADALVREGEEGPEVTVEIRRLEHPVCDHTASTAVGAGGPTAVGFGFHLLHFPAQGGKQTRFGCRGRGPSETGVTCSGGSARWRAPPSLWEAPPPHLVTPSSCSGRNYCLPTCPCSGHRAPQEGRDCVLIISLPSPVGVRVTTTGQVLRKRPKSTEKEGPRA